MPLLVSSVLLFYSGVVFAYFVVFPVMFSYLVGHRARGRELHARHRRVPGFHRCTLFFAFGIAFEVPVAVVLLVLHRARESARAWARTAAT